MRSIFNKNSVDSHFVLSVLVLCPFSLCSFPRLVQLCILARKKHEHQGAPSTWELWDERMHQLHALVAAVRLGTARLQQQPPDNRGEDHGLATSVPGRAMRHLTVATLYGTTLRGFVLGRWQLTAPSQTRLGGP